jgi:MoaA/NifB/PqqE/SkfB family radical SAM enzyme
VITLQEQNVDEICAMGEFALSNKCSIIYNVVRSDEIKYIQGFIDKVNLQKEKIASDFLYIQGLFKQTEPSLQCLIPDQMAGVSLPFCIGQTTHGSMQICPAIKKELCILYDGTVTPCNMFNPYEYGTLKENSLEEILTSKKCLDFKKNYKKCSYCRNCANLGV